MSLAGLIAAAGIVMSVLGALTTGISIDDPRHATRANVYWETGLYNTGTEVTRAGEEIPDESYVYGPVTALLQHALNLERGNDKPHRAARTAASYKVRHIVIAGIGFAGLLAVGAIGGLLLGSWRWGVVAAAVVAAVPMWTGHAMFNVKDTPVATGHTLATLGLVLLSGTSSGFKRTKMATGSAALILGTVLMVGTRPGMWTSLAVSTTILIAVLWRSQIPRREFWEVLAALAGSGAAAYGLLLAVYPRVFSNPLDMLWESATGSADYPHGKATVWDYVMIHTVQEWPLILLGLLLVGTVVAITRATHLLREHSPAAAGFLLVGSQAFTLPILVVIHHSRLYQGLRQLLFSVPAEGILATVGLAALLGAVTSNRQRILWSTAAAAGLILPTAVQAAMFPYQYTYINVAAEVAGVRVRNDPLDTSYRAMIGALPDNVKVVCPQHAKPLRENARNLGDCRTRGRGTLSVYWRASGRPATDSPRTNEFYAITRERWHNPTYCHPVYTIERWRNLGRTTISTLNLCKPPNTPKDATAPESHSPL